MEAQIQQIQQWLGTGSINIFGLPMSGKDTVGVNLANLFGAKFLSSGMIIRSMEEQTKQNLTGSGQLVPTDLFYEWVLPYFFREELEDFPLILSSIGRWEGEEDQVIESAVNSDHPIKAVISLNISESEISARWQASKLLNDRGERLDDKDFQVMQTRISEFNTKTVPVLRHYQELGLLIQVDANQSRELVMAEVLTRLAEFALRNS